MLHAQVSLPDSTVQCSAVQCCAVQYVRRTHLRTPPPVTRSSLTSRAASLACSQLLRMVLPSVLKVVVCGVSEPDAVAPCSCLVIVWCLEIDSKNRCRRKPFNSSDQVFNLSSCSVLIFIFHSSYVSSNGWDFNDIIHSNLYLLTLTTTL